MVITSANTKEVAGSSRKRFILDKSKAARIRMISSWSNECHILCMRINCGFEFVDV